MQKFANIMTLIVSMLFLTLSSINAEEVTGEGVYTAKCAVCHTLEMKKDISKEEKMKMMETMKAPPMSKISAKLKDSFDDNQTAVEAFLIDYIQNPSAEKAQCMVAAIEKFGVMPAIGKAMSEEERTAVAKWVFENFDEKWEGGNCKAIVGQVGKKCTGKCGDGKCGGDANSSKKCGAGKCGSDSKKAETKCGAGKCGGGK